MKKIIVTNRGHDYHARVEGVTGVWGCGSSEKAAIGDLVLAHQKGFGVAIERASAKASAQKELTAADRRRADGPG